MHEVARSGHRPLQLAVDVDVAFLFLFVPYPDDVVVASRFGVDAALGPNPVRFARRAHVGKEGQLRSLVGLRDEESRTARRHGAEHLPFGRAVRFYVGLEEYFERMAVRQPVDELLVGSVVGLVEAFVDRRARSVVEMGNETPVGVIVIGHHGHAGEGLDGYSRTGDVFGRPVVAEDDIEQVGLRHERLRQVFPGLLGDRDRFLEFGVGLGGEGDGRLALRVAADRCGERQPFGAFRLLGEPLLLLVDRIAPCTVRRDVEDHVAAVAGDFVPLGLDFQRAEGIVVRFVVFAGGAEHEQKEGEQPPKAGSFFHSSVGFDKF